MDKPRMTLMVLLFAVTLGGSSCSKPRNDSTSAIPVSSLPRLGSIDNRFQSYNVEMVEVTGGRFWKPYRDIEAVLKNETSGAKSREESAATPSGMNLNFYQYRPPIDLRNPRLRKLAAALGPAYVRVRGTWANATYFHDSSKPAPNTPPKGFGGVLTREQWDGVLNFARAVDAKLVTSFATSIGARDSAGNWKPDEARKLLGYTCMRTACPDSPAASHCWRSTRLAPLLILPTPDSGRTLHVKRCATRNRHGPTERNRTEARRGRLITGAVGRSSARRNDHARAGHHHLHRAA